MLTYRPKQIQELDTVTCDRCGLHADAEYPTGSDFLLFNMTCGYGSPFGDGTVIETDLCPDCIKATLGQWLRVRTPKWE